MQFKDTADKALQEPLLLTLSSYIWCMPYIAMTPAYCFALTIPDPAPLVLFSDTSATSQVPGPSTSDKSQSKAIGYILCAPDTLSFVKRWESSFLPDVVAPEGVVKRPHGDAAEVPGEWDKDRQMAIRRMVWHPRKVYVPEKYPRLLEVGHRKYPLQGKRTYTYAGRTIRHISTSIYWPIIVATAEAAP